MANELEKLLISLEADTKKLRLSLAQAESGVAGFEKAADKSLSKSERRFAQFNTFASGKLQALGAALVAAFATAKLKGDIVDVVALDKAAKAAGVTTDQLQRFGMAARIAGNSGEAMADALKELNEKIAEVRVRSGGYYEFLHAHLPTVEAQIRASKSTAEAMDIVAETVRRLGSAEERTLFIKKTLGEKSIELMDILAKGSDGFKAAAAEAEKYGQVLSKEAIQNTTELSKELDKLSATIGTKFKEALGAAAPVLTTAVKALREAMVNGISGSSAETDMWAAMFGGVVPSAKAAGEKAGAALIGAWETEVKKVESKPLKLAIKIPDFDTEISTDAADALAELNLKTLEATERTTEAITAEYEKEVERFRRMLADKKIDEEQFAKAREQLSINMGDKIKAAYEKERAEVRKLGEEFSSAMEGAFGNAFSELLEQGKINFRTFTASLLADLAKVYVQSQLIRPLVGAIGGVLSGGLAGIGGVAGAEGATGLASLFGGFRAEGGPVSAGKSYVVGEHGPELFTPRASGTITANGAGGSNVYNIDARGAEIGVEERIRAALMQVERERQSPVAAVAQYQRRFPTRKAA